MQRRTQNGSSSPMIRIGGVRQRGRLHGNARKHFHNLFEHLRFTLRNDHAAELIDDEYILFGRNFAEALNEKLQNVMRRFGRIFQGNGDMAQHHNDVQRHQAGFVLLLFGGEQSIGNVGHQCGHTVRIQ